MDVRCVCIGVIGVSECFCCGGGERESWGDAVDGDYVFVVAFLVQVGGVVQCVGYVQLYSVGAVGE